MSEGDQVAFTKIFDYYEPRIYPFVLKITRSEIIAEEIVQELFIKLWINRATATDIENPRSYIFRMAVNRSTGYLKKVARRMRMIESVTSQAVLEKNTTEDMVDYKETEDTINKLVEQLPSQQKKVYKL